MMGETKNVTLRAPSGALFAGVEVWATTVEGDWRKVGAAPAFRMESDVMVPVRDVGVDCYVTDDDVRLRCLWAYEYSPLGYVTTEQPIILVAGETTGRRRRLGGHR